MLRFLSFFSFIQSVVAQFRDPILTIAPPPTVPVLTIGSVAPIRTIPTITRPLTTTTTTTILTTTPTTILTTIPTTILTTIPTTPFLPQSTESNNLEESDTNLFFLIIPSGLLLVFFAYLCLKRRQQNVNVVNIDLNIENKIPIRNEPIRNEPIRNEPIRRPSNLSEHFYEEINYEARYEMPNVKYENVIENNEYGTQVTTSV